MTIRPHAEGAGPSPDSRRAAELIAGEGVVVHRPPLTIVVAPTTDSATIAPLASQLADQLIDEGALQFAPVADALQRFVIAHQPLGIAALLDLAPEPIIFLFDQAEAIEVEPADRTAEPTVHTGDGRSGWTTELATLPMLTLVAGSDRQLQTAEPGWGRLRAGTVPGDGVRIQVASIIQPPPPSGGPVPTAKIFPGLPPSPPPDVESDAKTDEPSKDQLQDTIPNLETTEPTELSPVEALAAATTAMEPGADPDPNPDSLAGSPSDVDIAGSNGAAANTPTPATEDAPPMGVAIDLDELIGDIDLDLDGDDDLLDGDPSQSRASDGDTSDTGNPTSDGDGPDSHASDGDASDNDASDNDASDGDADVTELSKPAFDAARTTVVSGLGAMPAPDASINHPPPPPTVRPLGGADPTTPSPQPGPNPGPPPPPATPEPAFAKTPLPPPGAPTYAQLPPPPVAAPPAGAPPTPAPPPAGTPNAAPPPIAAPPPPPPPAGAPNDALAPPAAESGPLADLPPPSGQATGPFTHLPPPSSNSAPAPDLPPPSQPGSFTVGAAGQPPIDGPPPHPGPPPGPHLDRPTRLLPPDTPHPEPDRQPARILPSDSSPPPDGAQPARPLLFPPADHTPPPPQPQPQPQPQPSLPEPSNGPAPTSSQTPDGILSGLPPHPDAGSASPINGPPPHPGNGPSGTFNSPPPIRDLPAPHEPAPDSPWESPPVDGNDDERPRD